MNLLSSKTRGGFTLIEVLVALAILTVVLGAVYSTFFLSHRAVDGLDDTMVKLQETRKTLDILRRELESVFYSERSEGSMLKIEDRDYYGKNATTISFTAFSNFRPGLSRITYRIREDDGKMTLMKNVKSPYMQTTTEDVELIEDIGEFSAEVRRQDQWIKTWDTEINRQVPDEIRITLSVPVKERQLAVFDTAKPRIGRTIL